MATMLDTQDPEDRQIRMFLIGGGIAAIGAILAGLVIIAAMISANFNILSWME